MRIEHIKYKDFNGNEHEEVHCFHLSKIERMRIDAKYKGGIQEWFTEQQATGIALPLLTAIEDVIQTAHGVKSEDGISFIKDPEATKKFVESEAYSEFVTSLFDGDDALEKFTDFLQDVVGRNA